VRFAHHEFVAAKEKLEIVSGAAPPPFRIFAVGFFRKNAFGLIQEYCTGTQLTGQLPLLIPTPNPKTPADGGGFSKSISNWHDRANLK